MNLHPFFKTFAKSPVIMPVIHVENPAQALKNAAVARGGGADGIWLIDHHGRPPKFLNSCFADIHSRYPELWVGLNYLNVDPENAFRHLPREIQGYWCDSLGLNTSSPEDREQATVITAAMVKSDWEGLLFGGVAFKYQPAVPSDQLGRVTLAARDVMDDRGVITTSGPRTGGAPDVEQIRIIRDALDSSNESAKCRHGCRYPLANASGISPENIGQYRDMIDCFLVASRITDPVTELLIPHRLWNLMEAVGR